MSTDHPDVQLLREALAGDRSARHRLVGRVGPLIEARIHRHLTNGRPIGINGVDDIAQQVWIRLFDRNGQRLHNFDPKKGSLEGYVSRIARNEIIDLIRRRSLRESVTVLHDEVDGVAPGPDPEARVAAKDLADRIRAHLKEVLPAKGRLVLVLLYDDIRSEDEAAEIMGVSKQVVANWKHKIQVLAREFREKNT